MLILNKFSELNKTILFLDSINKNYISFKKIRFSNFFIFNISKYNFIHFNNYISYNVIFIIYFFFKFNSCLVWNLCVYISIWTYNKLLNTQWNIWMLFSWNSVSQAIDSILTSKKLIFIFFICNKMNKKLILLIFSPLTN